jgi:AhpD family alkylhydroperoxidase
MDRSQRRSYRSPGELVRDLWAVLRQAQQIPPLMRGRSLAPAFRERLMLTVTQVNGCRYCAYAHARMALTEGLSHEEIESLGRGAFEEAPPAERPAIRYAQHWAAADGLPDPQAVQELHDLYGEEQAAAIDLSLRLIRVGNLAGNTWDKLVRRLGLARNASAS